MRALSIVLAAAGLLVVAAGSTDAWPPARSKAADVRRSISLPSSCSSSSWP